MKTIWIVALVGAVLFASGCVYEEDYRHHPRPYRTHSDRRYQTYDRYDGNHYDRDRYYRTRDRRDGPDVTVRF